MVKKLLVISILSFSAERGHAFDCTHTDIFGKKATVAISVVQTVDSLEAIELLETDTGKKINSVPTRISGASTIQYIIPRFVGFNAESHFLLEKSSNNNSWALYLVNKFHDQNQATMFYYKCVGN